jgi:hypothetical protein
VSEDIVYDTLFANIDFAIDNLPILWDDDNTGRATRGAALMLKAKMHMTRQQFAEAIPLLEEIRGLNYSLLDEYEQVFNPNNKNHSESIFEIQYSFALGQASNYVSSFVPWNSGSDLLSFGDVVVNASSRAGQNQPTQDLIDSYEANDKRRDVCISYYVINTDSIPWMSKFNYGFLDIGATDVNWQMFRYADALLMLAECLNEVNGLDQTAIGLVNRIRLRAGLSPVRVSDSQSLREAIAKERRLELAFENHRWFDLVRTGRAVEVMTAHGIQQKNEKNTVLPDAYTNIRLNLAIPTNQVQQFGYNQNEGW